MRLVIRLISFLVLALALASAPAFGAPERPAGATIHDTGVLAACEDGSLVNVTLFKLQDGGTRAEIHRPTKMARLVLMYKEAPGTGGKAYEIWDGDERVTRETLGERYPNGPCDLFKPKT